MNTINHALKITREALVNEGFIVLAHDPLHLIHDETGEEIVLIIGPAYSTVRGSKCPKCGTVGDHDCPYSFENWCARHSG